jgi:hypothetical protein
MLCAFGVAAVLDLLPSFSGMPRDDAALEKMQDEQGRAFRSTERTSRATDPAPAVPLAAPRTNQVATRCDECGVVESTREVVLNLQTAAPSAQAQVLDAAASQPPKIVTGRDVSIRMDNGASRVVYQRGASAWRFGDRVRIVDGTLRPN